MRMIKYGLLFILAFIVAWVLIFTFTQTPFKTAVPVRIFTYTTQAFPIYAYVIIAFTAGLVVGLLYAIYIFITMNIEMMRKKRAIHSLKDELEIAQTGQSLPTTQSEDPQNPRGKSPPENTVSA
jgi:uncharacterized membrane protein YciS (DUF1049 family)